MKTPIQENPWPTRWLVLRALFMGYVLVVGVMAYMYHIGKVGRLAPPLWAGAAAMAGCFALLFFAITLAVRRSGNWTVSDQGLHFLGYLGNVEWQISWDSISRMKYTSVTLVVWWTGEPIKPPGPWNLRRAVLFIEKKQASNLIGTWRSRSQTSAGQEF